jgi:hypothetical protein
VTVSVIHDRGAVSSTAFAEHPAGRTGAHAVRISDRRRRE